MPSKLVLLILLINSSLSQDLLSKFNQNDYKLKDLRTELVSYDPTLVKYVTLATFKYNRTTPALNFSVSFLIDIDKMGVVTQVYKFASNEYRHFPSMRFQFDAREAFDTNIIGLQKIKKCGNIQSAYFQKGVNYYFCNFVPDERKFPPFIPTGQYKANCHCFQGKREIFVYNYYIEAYRPIAIPKN